MKQSNEVPTCVGDAYGDCDQPALYVRHTQFAGSHPLCALHALKDSNCLMEDSYQFWEKLSVDATHEDAKVKP